MKWINISAIAGMIVGCIFNWCMIEFDHYTWDESKSVYIIYGVFIFILSMVNLFVHQHKEKKEGK